MSASTGPAAAGLTDSIKVDSWCGHAAGWCARRSTLVDAGELVGIELGDRRIVRGDELVGDALGDLAHAGLLRRGALVVLHALGLQLADGLLRRGSAHLALVAARLVGGVVHDLLLGRRELVPEALAHEHDVRRVDVVGRADELLHLEEPVSYTHLRAHETP